MRTRLTAALAVAASLTLTACGSDEAETTAAGSDSTAGDAGETVTVTDASGAEVEVPLNPEVVVTTDLSVARTLNDLGVELDGVPSAKGGLPEDMTALKDVATVGTVKEPDYEGISALEPDLVIVAGRTGTPEVIAEMKKITPNVVDLSARWEKPADQLPTIEDQVLDAARIFGKEAEAQKQMDEATQGVEEIAEAAKESGDTAMFVQVSGGTASAYGPGSRFGVLYEQLGFKDTGAPIDPAAEHGQEISPEFFTQYNPDVIFVLDRSATIGEKADAALDVLNNGLVDSTTAAKDGRIVEVDGFSWYIANNSPTSLQQMVEDVKSAL